jgi:hypothetical protein
LQADACEEARHLSTAIPAYLTDVLSNLVSNWPNHPPLETHTLALGRRYSLTVEANAKGMLRSSGPGSESDSARLPGPYPFKRNKFPESAVIRFQGST